MVQLRQLDWLDGASAPNGARKGWCRWWFTYQCGWRSGDLSGASGNNGLFVGAVSADFVQQSRECLRCGPYRAGPGTTSSLPQSQVLDHLDEEDAGVEDALAVVLTVRGDGVDALADQGAQVA